MATGYYPNRIRTFPTHVDFTEDVLADHVNSIQAELYAVMFALGTAPQVYNNIETDEVPSADTPNDDGSVIDDDTLFTSQFRYYDPKQKPVNHGTVGARLDDIERGTQHHAFHLRANNLDIASKSVALDQRPRGVRFPKPASKNDPYGLHNGVGVTLRKAGFWIFFGSTLYTLQGAAQHANDGIYQSTIDVDGDYLEGMVRHREDGSLAHPSLNPTLAGFFPRGARVSLRSSHNSGRNQKIRRAALSGILLRETID